MNHTPLGPQSRPDISRELKLYREGHALIAGLDEAGRGALAGPVVAAAVILPLDRFDLAGALDGVRDSKQMQPDDREHWADAVWQVAKSIGIGSSSASEVDELGLLPATRNAMARAIRSLAADPAYLLVDHIPLPELEHPQKAITRGDQQVLSIAAASVIAKVARDRWMRELAIRYPGYGFGRHKGYGTAHHQRAIERLGPCAEHRRSYSPVERALRAQA